jgi:hypothetical protein
MDAMTEAHWQHVARLETARMARGPSLTPPVQL